MSEWQVVFVFCFITVVIIAIAVFGVMWEARLQHICIDNGYAEQRSIGTKRYCVGVRDGNTVVVLLESLK